jgi:uracil-DNA glycosylase
MNAAASLLVSRHRREWRASDEKDRAKRLAMLAAMRNEHECPALLDKVPSHLGHGSLEPDILLLCKSPRSRDLDATFEDASWQPIFEHLAPGKFYAAYLLPRRVRFDEEFGTRATNTEAEQFGWYAKMLVETLRPRLVVCVSAYVARAMLANFQSNRISNVGRMHEIVNRTHEMHDPRRKYLVLPIYDPYAAKGDNPQLWDESVSALQRYGAPGERPPPIDTERLVMSARPLPIKKRPLALRKDEEQQKGPLDAFVQRHDAKRRAT